MEEWKWVGLEYIRVDVMACPLVTLCDILDIFETLCSCQYPNLIT